MKGGGDDSHAGWAARPPALLRLVLVIGLVSLVGAAAGAADAARSMPPVQELVTLLASQAVRTAQSQSGAAIAQIAGRRPLTGVRTVLPVLGRTAGGWVRVRLPGRPNGRTGWI